MSNPADLSFDAYRRLVYGDVRNHLASPRLVDLMGGQLFTFHALVSVHDDFAEDLIEAVNGETLGRRMVRIEFAEAD